MKRKLMLLLGAALLLALVGGALRLARDIVLAQSGGDASMPLGTGYDVGWSVVGSAGDQFVSGGDYQMGFTLAQDTPPLVSSGGDYQVAQGFWNGSPSACTRVTGVNLALVTSGAVYTDTVVEFSADVIPDAADKPYTYTIDYGDGISTTTLSYDDPLTTPLDHTFIATGTYDIEIAVWNCNMTEVQAMTDTVQVVVSEQGVTCAEVTSVDLSLVTSGDIYTNTVVKFSADILPDNASKPYTYTVDYGAGVSAPVISSYDPLTTPLDHTFAATGTYEVEIAVWNCDMTEVQAMTDTVQVVVSERPSCTKVTGVDLSLMTSGDIYTDTVVEFSADIIPNDASKPYTCTIDYGMGASTPAFSHDDPLTAPLDHTFTATGTYEVEIAVWNCAMTEAEAVTDTVQVIVSERPGTCAEVTSVDLSLVTSGDIYTDTVVKFSADIIPDNADKPYTYTVDYGAGASAPALSSDDPLTTLLDHTFAATGTYEVEIAVWNCDMTEAEAMTNAITLTVYAQGACVDLTEITIHGDESGTPGVYTFTTSYEPPDATPPIAYLWNHGDDTAISIESLGVGTHTLMVTATNCTTALVTDTYIIVIQNRIYLPLVLRNHS
jgi:hypothetical protein